MTKFFLQIIGWLLAHTPEFLLHFTSWMLGPVVLLLPKRRAIVYSNLHHAFPNRPRAWHKRIARKSSRRLIETSMLSLASPYLSDARIRKIARLMPSAIAGLERRVASMATANVLGTLHLAYWESLTWLPLFMDYQVEVGVVFRPLKNPNLNEWIKRTRERHGAKLCSRRDGLFEIFRILKRRGVVSILFDQNAGGAGALTTFMGRACSTTEFPGTLIEKYQAQLSIIATRRFGFWRVGYELIEIPNDGTSVGTTIALNRWLEDTLANDENMCASWLWSHARWKAQTDAWQRFHFQTKHDFLDADLAAHGYTRATMPRKMRVWMRFPENIGADTLAAAQPLFRALRDSRPDMEMTFIASPADVPALQSLIDEKTADRLIELPESSSASRALFRKLHDEYPDTIVNLCESARADAEAEMTGSPQRFGFVRAGSRRRSRLTNVCELKADFLATNPSLVVLWRKLFENFGLPPEAK